MGKYYVPDDKGNYREYESKEAYEEEKQKQIDEHIEFLFSDRWGSAVSSTLFAIIPLFYSGHNFWGVVWSILTVLLVLAPSSKESETFWEVRVWFTVVAVVIAIVLIFV